MDKKKKIQPESPLQKKVAIELSKKIKRLRPKGIVEKEFSKWYDQIERKIIMDEKKKIDRAKKRLEEAIESVNVASLIYAARKDDLNKLEKELRSKLGYFL